VSISEVYIEATSSTNELASSDCNSKGGREREREGGGKQRGRKRER